MRQELDAPPHGLRAGAIRQSNGPGKSPRPGQAAPRVRSGIDAAVMAHRPRSPIALAVPDAATRRPPEWPTTADSQKLRQERSASAVCDRAAVDTAPIDCDSEAAVRL